jgi:hypothetical protein
MRLNPSLWKFLVSILLLAALAFPVTAQSDRGAIVGTVLDSSGGVIEGATITAKGVETGTVYNTASTSTGAYRF